jgi:hypothetical protein
MGFGIPHCQLVAEDEDLGVLGHPSMVNAGEFNGTAD